MPFATKYLIVIFTLLTSLHVNAQYMRGGRFARMEDLEIRNGKGSETREVRPNESFGHRITVVNNSNQPARFRLDMRQNRYFRLVYSTGQTITVPAHDSVSVGLKILNINARVNGVYTIYLDLHNLDDEGDVKAYEFNVEVFDGSDRSMIIQPLQENVYIEHKEKEFEVPVLLKNLLPDDARVRFEVQNGTQSPYKLMETFQHAVHVPGNDTVLNMRFLVPVQFFDINRLNAPLTIYMRNDKGDLLGMFSVNPRWLVSTGDFMTPGLFKQDETFAQLLYTNYGNNLSSVNFTAGKPLSEDSHFGFNMNYMRNQPSGQDWLINTFAAYQGKNLDLRAGSINDFHELSLLGRGFKGRMDFQDHSDRSGYGRIKGESENSVEFWAVDGEYNLLSPFSMVKGTKTLSARYNNLDENRDGIQASASYFMRADVRSTGTLAFGNWRSKLGERQHLGLTVAGSYEKFNHPNGDTTTPGYSVRADYTYAGKKIQASFMALKASRDYSGVLQGSTMLNGMANYNIKPRLNLTYTVIGNLIDKPIYSDTSIYGKFKSEFTQNGLQLTRGVRNMQWYLKGYLFTQRQLYTDTATHSAGNRLVSMRLQGGASSKIRSVFLSGYLDLGTVNAQFPTYTKTGIPSFRLNASVVYKNLSFVGMTQRGPYFISDMFYLRTRPEDIKTFNATISYDKRFFSKIDFMASIGVNKHSNFDGTQVYANAGADYAMGKGFTAIGRLLLTSNAIRSNLIVSVGLRKTFDFFDGENARVRLNARLYFDRNYNGEKDPGEDWAEGVVFKFDDLNLISGRNGEVTLKNVEKGWHKFSVTTKGTDGFQSLSEQKLELDHNERMDIGIPPQFELKGRVVEDRSRFQQAAASLEGIKIIIRKENQEWFVYTQKDGRFRMLMKPGRYKVSIEQVRKMKGEAAEKEVVIHPEKGLDNVVELTWESNERKVDVKKLEPKQ